MIQGTLAKGICYGHSEKNRMDPNPKFGWDVETDDTTYRSEDMKALPWWSSDKDSAHPMQGTWVQSLAKELDPTCHMSHVAMKIQCSQINTYKFLKGSMNRFITH